MNGNRPSGLGDIPEYLYEFLFILNLILSARVTEGLRDFWPFRYLFFGSWESKLEFAIQDYFNHRLHPNAHFVPKDLPGHIAFLVVTVAIALGGTLILTYFSRNRLIRELLRSVAGLSAVLTLPACWLYVTALYPQYSPVPSLPRLWLYFELALISTVVLLRVFLRRSLPVWGLAGIVLIHEFAWGWLFLGGASFWLSPFLSLVPTTALIASITWLIYVTRAGMAEWKTLQAPPT